MKEMLVTGRVRGSHGVRGCVKVMSLSGETQHLLSLRRISLRKSGEEVVLGVEYAEPLGPDVLVKLAGVDTPEDARKYSGWEVWVGRSAVPPPKKNEYFAADLHGCEVVVEQKAAGHVVAVLETNLGAYLEVVAASEGENGKPVRALIPFSERSIGRVDVASGSIELLEPWLLE